MARIEIVVDPIDSDPDLDVGGFITLERADGRSVWRQRFVVSEKSDNRYVLVPVKIDVG